jgi:hypothetical protein
MSIMTERGALDAAIATLQARVKERDDEIARLNKLVYVPGHWRCAKCNFRLVQSNLYAATGTVGPRDEPGDKCPNCASPLWRVSAMDDRNEAYKTANDLFDRADRLRKALQEIHDREWPAGDFRRAAETAAEMWRLSDQALEEDERPPTERKAGAPAEVKFS